MANVAAYNSPRPKEAQHASFCAVFREVGGVFARAQPRAWAGLWELEVKVTLTHFHTALPALLWSAATGHQPRGHWSRLRHTHKVHEEWESSGGSRGPVAGCQQGSPSAQRHTQHAGPQTAVCHTVYEGENET